MKISGVAPAPLKKASIASGVPKVENKECQILKAFCQGPLFWFPKPCDSPDPAVEASEEKDHIFGADVQKSVADFIHAAIKESMAVLSWLSWFIIPLASIGLEKVGEREKNGHVVQKSPGALGSFKPVDDKNIDNSIEYAISKNYKIRTGLDGFLNFMDDGR